MATSPGLTGSEPGSGPRVALASRDARLIADVRRLCAAAAAGLDVVSDPAGMLRCWRSAPLLLVDADAAETLLARPAPRRGDVVVLADDADRVEVWRAAARLGADQVFALPADERLLLGHIADLGRLDATPGAWMLGVIPGAGGAGASVLAASMCLTAAGVGRAVTLIDLDPLGGGADLLFGAEHAAGARWPDLAGVPGVIAPDALDQALPRVAGVRVLSCARIGTGPLPETVAMALPAARRGDLVVVDLPRRPDPAAEIAAASCDRLLVVTTAQVRATAATAQVLTSLAGTGVDVRLVVRTLPRGRLRPADVREALDLPLAGVMETEPAIAEAADGGELATVLRRTRLAALASNLVDGSRDPQRAA